VVAATAYGSSDRLWWQRPLFTSKGSLGKRKSFPVLWWQRPPMVAATAYGSSDRLWWQRPPMVAAPACTSSDRPKQRSKQLNQQPSQQATKQATQGGSPVFLSLKKENRVPLNRTRFAGKWYARVVIDLSRLLAGVGVHWRALASVGERWRALASFPAGSTKL